MSLNPDEVRAATRHVSEVGGVTAAEAARNVKALQDALTGGPEVVTEPAPSPYDDDPGTSKPAKPQNPPDPDKTGPVAANRATDG